MTYSSSEVTSLFLSNVVNIDIINIGITLIDREILACFNTFHFIIKQTPTSLIVDCTKKSIRDHTGHNKLN